MDRGVTAMDIILRAGQAGIMAATITEDIIQVEISLCIYTYKKAYIHSMTVISKKYLRTPTDK